jgi:uncharacterized protein (TIGR03067 family)
MEMHMRWLMTIGVIAVSTCLATSQTVGQKTDQDLLQGVWQAVGMEMFGKPMPAEMLKEMPVQLTVKGNTMEYKNYKMSVKDVGGKAETTKTEEIDTATFKLDSSKKPKQIDIATKK